MGARVRITAVLGFATLSTSACDSTAHAAHVAAPNAEAKEPLDVTAAIGANTVASSLPSSPTHWLGRSPACGPLAAR